MPAPSLDLYRSLVPEHSAVLDATIETWLGVAVRRHTAAAWGAAYGDAMVAWAAHRIQRTPGSGAPGTGSSTEVGAIASQRDGDLSRSYATPASTAMTPSDAELQTTRYGQDYLAMRDSRAASGPTFVGPCL